MGSLTDQSLDGFDRADAQIFTGVPQNALFSKTVEDGAHYRAGGANEIRQLLLGEADVRAETMLAPRLERPGQLPKRLGQPCLCPFEYNTFQPPLHLPLAPRKRFDHTQAEDRLIEQQLMELFRRNAPNSNRALGSCRFRSLAHALSTQSGAKKFANCHQSGRQFPTLAIYPGKLDLSIENAEQIIAALTLIINCASMSK